MNQSCKKNCSYVDPKNYVKVLNAPYVHLVVMAWTSITLLQFKKWPLAF